MRVAVETINYNELAMKRIKRLLEQGATVDLQIGGMNPANTRRVYEKELRAVYGEKLAADVSPWQALYKLL